MPQKYKDKRTAKFAAGDRVKEFQGFERQAYKRLEILEAAPNQQFQIQNDFAPFQRFTEILRIINFSWCKGFRAVKF